MTTFIIQFFIANLFISGIIVLFLILKKILKSTLTNRMQYNLWYVFIGLLVVPFLPIHSAILPQIISCFSSLFNSQVLSSAISNEYSSTSSINSNWMEEFVVSVNKSTHFTLGSIMLVIWIIGIFAMLIKFIIASFHLHKLIISAFPIESLFVDEIYYQCSASLGIHKFVPIYCTEKLKSPVITGLINPKILLPSHIMLYGEQELKFILLHELSHYKHKDEILSYLMNLVITIYWFNPIIRIALNEMNCDREVACDTTVLNILDDDSYENYGNTLINLSKKLSHSLFATGIGGNTKQIHKRIMNIATYEKPNAIKKAKSLITFLLFVIILASLTPFITTNATGNNHYHWDYSNEQIDFLDLSEYFHNYEGSFVLYDLENNKWHIYNMERACLRVSPNSTYKIYDALFALEEGVITHKNSDILWNGEQYPFPEWNTDQSLNSAMENSVNWYFQTIDNSLGRSRLQSYIRRLGYGNEVMGDDLSTYWLESSLKISPIEQVELLTIFHNSSSGFSPEHITAVKEAICLSSTQETSLYGKTGTGRVNGNDVNGWFIGFIELNNNTYYFATNICAKNDATGSKAAEITMSILSDMNIWK